MKIHVDMIQVMTNAAYISQQAQQYAGVYGNIYQLLDEMGTIWQGKDYDAFAQQLVAFRKDFDRMKQVLEDYAAYLRESASIYRRLQEECMTMAGRLRY